MPTLFLLVAAPSCSSASVKELAKATGRSADDLARPVDDVAQQTGRSSDTVANELKASGPAMEVIGKAKEPAVQAACQLALGFTVPNPTDPDVVPWLQRINFALLQGEPMKDACGVVAKLAALDF